MDSAVCTKKNALIDGQLKNQREKIKNCSKLAESFPVEYENRHIDKQHKEGNVLKVIPAIIKVLELKDYRKKYRNTNHYICN